MKDKESDTKNKSMDYEVEGCKNLDKKNKTGRQQWLKQTNGVRMCSEILHIYYAPAPKIGGIKR